MTVLIAEDERLESSTLEFLLNKHYGQLIKNIVVVSNGFKAVEAVKKEHIDLIFIDIHMPVMNGLDALGEIRKIDSQAIIVILTAYSKFEYAKDAITYGVCDYIVKPYSVKTLDETMKRVINTLKSRTAHDTTEPDEMIKKNKNYRMIERAKEYMHLHLAEQMSLVDIANYVGISHCHLSRCFKDSEGIHLKSYLLNERIKQAKEYLFNGYTVAESAYKAGFNDPAYFSKCFKRLVGFPPTSFQKA
jgi:YesN/AraC family two-component response regulator